LDEIEKISLGTHGRNFITRFEKLDSLMLCKFVFEKNPKATIFWRSEIGEGRSNK